jgi:hypothetical protein
MTDNPDAAAQPPFLRVVHGGEPTAEELTALVVALSARGPADAPPARSLWADRSAALRRPLRAGPGAWRASGHAPGVRTRAGL